VSFTGLPYYSSIRIQAVVLKIDEWNSEKIQVKVQKLIKKYFNKILKIKNKGKQPDNLRNHFYKWIGCKYKFLWRSFKK
jgi:hypothetical protein